MLFRSETVTDYNKFVNKTYSKDKVRIGNSGCFNIEYVPNSKLLNITLKICFKEINKNGYTNMTDTDKEYFITNAINTWSDKFKIYTKHKGLWENLNPISVKISLEEEVVDENAAMFNIWYYNGNDKKSSRVDNNQVILTNIAFENTCFANNNNLTSGMNSRGEELIKYNVLGHEFGHMIGLDDEYITINEKDRRAHV